MKSNQLGLHRTQYGSNSYTYTTWGTPTTFTHNGYPDLGFRFLYVGRHGVAWDSALGLGLEFMGARHYSPSLGRFLQPDPSALEDNLYGYVSNNPITLSDPGGLAGPGVIVIPVAWCLLRWRLCLALVVAGAEIISNTGRWLIDHPIRLPSSHPLVNGREVNPNQCYGRGPCRLLLNQNKQIKTRIKGLEKQAELHSEKLRRNPHSPYAEKWEKEIKNLETQIKNLQRRLPQFR